MKESLQRISQFITENSPELVQIVLTIVLFMLLSLVVVLYIRMIVRIALNIKLEAQQLSEDAPKIPVQETWTDFT